MIFDINKTLLKWTSFSLLNSLSVCVCVCVCARARTHVIKEFNWHFILLIIMDFFSSHFRYTDEIELEDAVHTAILTLKEGYIHTTISFCTVYSLRNA